MNRLLREPTLQFLVLAAALFGFYSLLDNRQAEAPARIVVSQTQIETLRQGFVNNWLRDPSPEELQELVEDYIRDEVYYREATALGLDRDDTVIRRHLRLKMELFAESLDAPSPDDAELEAYLAAHPERFRAQDRISFRHVFLSGARGDALVTDVSELAMSLSESPDMTAPVSSDEFLAGDALDGAGRSEVSRVFGQAFADRVFEIEMHGWQGPIASPYGLHFVHVTDRESGEVPPLAEIRDIVESEWRRSNLQQEREAFYRSLRERYEVVIEAP